MRILWGAAWTWTRAASPPWPPEHREATWPYAFNPYLVIFVVYILFLDEAGEHALHATSMDNGHGEKGNRLLLWRCGEWRSRGDFCPGQDWLPVCFHFNLLYFVLATRYLMAFFRFLQDNFPRDVSGRVQLYRTLMEKSGMFVVCVFFLNLCNYFMHYTFANFSLCPRMCLPISSPRRWSRTPPAAMNSNGSPMNCPDRWMICVSIDTRAVLSRKLLRFVFIALQFERE